MNPEVSPVYILIILLTVSGITIAGMSGVIWAMLGRDLKGIKDEVSRLLVLREEDSGKHNTLQNDHTALRGRVESVEKTVTSVVKKVEDIEKQCKVFIPRNGDRRACERGEG